MNIRMTFFSNPKFNNSPAVTPHFFPPLYSEIWTIWLMCLCEVTQVCFSDTAWAMETIGFASPKWAGHLICLRAAIWKASSHFKYDGRRHLWAFSPLLDKGLPNWMFSKFGAISQPGRIWLIHDVLSMCSAFVQKICRNATGHLQIALWAIRAGFFHLGHSRHMNFKSQNSTAAKPLQRILGAEIYSFWICQVGETLAYMLEAVWDGSLLFREFKHS